MKDYKGIKLTHETDQVASHQPALIWAIENTTGNVLELGTGDCSTVLIHELLKGTGRKITSVEDNVEWMNKYIHMESLEHDFHLLERSVDSWNDATDHYANMRWGVVFVDQGCGEDIWRPTRNYAVQTLIDSADYIVAHDSDVFPEMKSDDYNWIEYVPHYKPEPGRKGPPTYIFSKIHDLSNLNIQDI